MKLIDMRDASGITVQDMLKFLEEVHQDSPFKDEQVDFRLGLTRIVAQPYIKLLVNDDENVLGGILAGTLFEGHVMGLVGVETFFYVAPGWRGKDSLDMLADFEQWSKDNGANVVSVSHYAGDDRIGSLYKRKGYELAELTYSKKI